MLVQRTAGGEITQQVTGAIEWSSSHPGVATVANGVVRPVGDGEAIITARIGGQAATAKVGVTGMKRPFDWSFRNHVEPVLAKLGLQLGRLPRGPGRQRGIPTLAARLRPGGRFLQHGQARSRAARRVRRSRPQPHPRQAVRRHPPQGRSPVHDRLARIPDPRRLDRRRGLAADGGRLAHRARWTSCPPARSTASARPSRSSSAPATATAAPRMSPPG